MSSYPPGGDYDERLLDNAPKATKAERQEGYNVNLLASDSSDAPMNTRTPATVDGHGATLETGTPPDKEVYTPSYSVPWYRQGKWRVFMLIGGIIIIGAVVGGVVGGTVSHKNKNDQGSGPSTTLSAAPIDTSLAPAASNNGPLLSSTSSPLPQTTTGATTGRPNNGTVDMGESPAAIAAWVD